jgi:hypothetical protein
VNVSCFVMLTPILSLICSPSSDGEIGGLQASAGMAAQAQPLSFLPHELRQHELRFGGATNTTSLARAQPSAVRPHELRQHELRFGVRAVDPTVSFQSAKSFEKKLQQQMRQTQQWNDSHHLHQAGGGAFMHTHPHSVGQTSAPHPGVDYPSASVSSVRLNPRVGAALLKAHDSLGLDFPPPKRGSANPANPRTLPAASNIAPELAYLQQLRRREIMRDGKEEKRRSAKK